MKLQVLAVVLFLFVAVSTFAEMKTYKVAHVRYEEQNFVFVKVGAGFFTAPLAKQRRWWTGFKACARQARMNGEVFVVSNVNGEFRFYGSRDLHDIVRNLDMDWVNARLNKKLDCDF